MLSDELTRHVLPMTQFDGLCLAASDAGPQAAFWQAALGGHLRDLSEGRFRIDPAPGRPVHEIMRVDPVTVLSGARSRVHLDLRLGDRGPGDLLAAGATIVRAPDLDPWYVLADPEGNEFCAFPAVDDRPPGIFELVVKCRDAHRLARWWGQVLGGRVVTEGEAAVVIGAPEFPWDFMVFDPVPEPKDGPNRLHWHLDLREEDPTGLVELGAAVLRAPSRDRAGWVLEDPEGNEFCARPAAHRNAR